jgi:predicted alpha/beta hydrolase family esterase
MKKKVFIIHGWDGSPNEQMLQWLKLSLEKRGYRVAVPEMPDADVPKIGKWIGKLKEIIKPDSNTILVGHSIGCQAILRYIETLPENAKIAGVVLIAPWMELDKQTIEEEGEEIKQIAKPWMETPIDFGKIRKTTNNFVAIFSDNDPYVPLEQKTLFKKELNAKIIIEHDKGHFTIGDKIKELQSALDSILNF